MLSRCRVLDLTDERGLLCGQILADLGADVIQVEPPGGSTARRIGPHYKDDADVEHSLFWWAYTRNKRGIVLDLEDGADRDRLRALLRSSDFLIESARPGRMAELGLAYEDVARIQPGLVYVSITPFGQDGPKAHYADTDLIVMAAGGPLYLSGEADHEPVRTSVPQAHAHAGADAAVAALIAHFGRRRTGRGQHVDVSSQQSATLATMFRSLDAPLGDRPARRTSHGVRVRDVMLRTRLDARDGSVFLLPGLIPSVGRFMDRMMGWAHEEGHCDAKLLEEEWGSYAIRLAGGERTVEDYAPVDAAIEALVRDRTKAELMRAAVERKLLIAPVFGIDEIVESEQLAARDFVREVEHPAQRTSFRYPGPFARFARTPIRYRQAPPRLGEHRAEALLEERPAGPASPAPEAAAGLPLEGVKILDLFWVLAGPGATRMLADFGATVVHVESTNRIDTIRTVGPYHDRVPGPENTGAFQSTNAGKLCVTLDLAREDALEVVRDLARWADVVTESFTPGVVEALGLDYASLSALKPDLIMISSCLMGQTGPLRSYAGFGNLAAAVTGFHPLAGLPGRVPTGPFAAYTDFIAVRYNAAAILAALEHRAHTGEGQYIDQSQAEAALHFLAPAFLDYTVNGRAGGPVGNADPQMVPHGVYPARGDDRWVALAVRDTADWQELCGAIERPDLAADAELETRRGRRARSDEIDAAVGAWTAARDPAESERVLQARGVPAHAVLDTSDLYADAQLAHRGHYVEIPHPLHGTTTIEGARFRLSESAAQRPEHGLTYGCHNHEVLAGILAYDEARIAALEESGALR